VQRDCSSKRVLVVIDDGAYFSSSDFDEDTLALFAADHAGNEGTPEEHIDAGAAEHYESLIVQRVLSAQMENVGTYRQGYLLLGCPGPWRLVIHNPLLSRWVTWHATRA
jgi:hypothetical protein